MKQTFLFLLFAVFATVGAQAQANKSCAATCSKAKMAACTAKGTSTAKAAVPATASFVNLGSADDEIALVAARKAGNVERVVDAEKRTAVYMRKDVCATSGKVSYANVEYCTKSKQFINVSPTAAAGAKASCCTKGAKAACAKDQAKVKLVKE